MTPTRYAGRHGGPGIDDRLPGPETIAALFTGAGTVIADPVSFPWHLMSDDDLRQPLLVDLTKCTADDLIALEQVLPVLTPDDRVAAFWPSSPLARSPAPLFAKRLLQFFAPSCIRLPESKGPAPSRWQRLAPTIGGPKRSCPDRIRSCRPPIRSALLPSPPPSSSCTVEQ